MTDSTKPEGKDNKLEHAVRTVVVKSNKKRHILEDSSIISKLAREKIHNLMKINVGVYDPIGTDFGVDNPIGKDRVITLTTDDSSYDLNGFYEQLTKHGYAIQ
jgi:hypothetical protein